MEKTDKPSDRLIDQRLRNRIMESLEVLNDGDQAVLLFGASEYFNLFFDYVDDEITTSWRDLSTFTPEEVKYLEAVQWWVQEDCQQTPQMVTEEALIASGWPTLIQPVA